MKCKSCGGENSSDSRICEYCGSRLPPAPTERSAVFERIKASPEYRRRDDPARHARLPKHTAVQKAILLGFFAVFTGGSIFMFFMALAMAGVVGGIGGHVQGGSGAAFSFIPLCMSIVPAAFVAIGIYGFIKMKKKMNTIATAPVEAKPVIIVDKRTQVSGGGNNSSARTSYFVTCETEEGDRDEHQVWDGALYGKMADDDAGVLFLRAGYALDFDRVAINGVE